MLPAIVFDIDGTLANIEHRVHYVRNGRKDWKRFSEAMVHDTVREDVKALYTTYHMIADMSSLCIVLVSGRNNKDRMVTHNWLHQNGIFYHALFMRGDNDYRSDVIVKQEIYDTILSKRYKVHLVIDDRPSILKMWERNGLKVLDVGNGVDF